MVATAAAAVAAWMRRTGVNGSLSGIAGTESDTGPGPEPEPEFEPDPEHGSRTQSGNECGLTGSPGCAAFFVGVDTVYW
jgi:hypothetical protein